MTHNAENVVTCACRWERDAAGRLDFRECPQHHVARVFPPAVTDGDGAA